MRMEEREQHLYRHFDSDNNLLYVGISLNAVNRLVKHRSTAHWFSDIAKITVEKYPDRFSVIRAEREAIQKENPKYNINCRKPEDLAEDVRQDTEHVQLMLRKMSGLQLLSRMVSLKPTYTVTEVSELLEIKQAKVRELIEQDILGAFYVRHRNTRYGMRPVYRISGWHLMDYLDQVEVGDITLGGEPIEKDHAEQE